MNGEREATDPAEAFFNARFLEIYKECKRNGDYNDLWVYGVAYINNSFYLLANSETRETIVEMWKSGRLPPALVVASGANSKNEDVFAWQVSLYVTRKAQTMDADSPEGFRWFAKGLGVVEADNLRLYKLRDPRKMWERVGDKIALVLEETRGTELPWSGKNQEFYQHDRALRSKGNN